MQLLSHRPRYYMNCWWFNVRSHYPPNDSPASLSRRVSYKSKCGSTVCRPTIRSKTIMYFYSPPRTMVAEMFLGGRHEQFQFLIGYKTVHYLQSGVLVANNYPTSLFHPPPLSILKIIVSSQCSPSRSLSSYSYCGQTYQSVVGANSNCAFLKFDCYFPPNSLLT
jgi:hypothetical protein